MTCPDCNTRMKCWDSACFDNITARRYKCVKCGKKRYTIEHETDRFEVLSLLNKKRQEYNKYGRRE